MNKLKYPFDVQFILGRFKNERLEELKKELLKIGNSLDIFSIQDTAKVHIHTDSPERVKEVCENFGEISDWTVEDMQVQVDASARKIGLITTADLPKEITEKYGIRTVVLHYDFPEQDLGEGSFYQKLRKAKKLPTTSQLNPADFAEIYQEELEKFDYLLVTTLTSKQSGTFNSAIQAREQNKNKERIRVIDSSSATIGEGIFVLKACQLIEEGKDIEQIEKELNSFKSQIRLYGALGDLKFIQFGGRVRGIKFLSGIIGKLINYVEKVGLFWPLLTIRDDKIKIGGAKFFTRNLVSVLFSPVKKADPKGNLAIAIGYSDNFSQAEALKKKIIQNLPQAKILFLSEINPVIGCHTGPETLIIAFCPADKLKVVD